MPGWQLGTGIRHPARSGQIMAGLPSAFVVSGFLFSQSSPGGALLTVASCAGPERTNAQDRQHRFSGRAPPGVASLPGLCVDEAATFVWVVDEAAGGGVSRGRPLSAARDL